MTAAEFIAARKRLGLPFAERDGQVFALVGRVVRFYESGRLGDQRAYTGRHRLPAQIRPAALKPRQGGIRSKHVWRSPSARHRSPRASRDCTRKNPPLIAPGRCETSSSTRKNRTTRNRNPAKPKNPKAKPRSQVRRWSATMTHPFCVRRRTVRCARWPCSRPSAAKLSKERNDSPQPHQQAQQMRDAFKEQQQKSPDHGHDRER